MQIISEVVNWVITLFSCFFEFFCHWWSDVDHQMTIKSWHTVIEVIEYLKQYSKDIHKMEGSKRENLIDLQICVQYLNSSTKGQSFYFIIPFIFTVCNRHLQTLIIFSPYISLFHMKCMFSLWFFLSQYSYEEDIISFNLIWIVL